jgi:Ty3 transposon capsid-like protein/Zinc knuckle
MAIEDFDNSTTGMRPRQPDKYHGQRDFLLLGNWIFSVDQFFTLTDMPVLKQAAFVSTLLRDEALLWFRSYYANQDPKTPLTWNTLRAAMQEYFAPPNEDRRLQDEWANLRQHGTVFEYVSVLTALAMRIPGLGQNQILDKFIRGLKPKTRIEVELRDPKTPDEAYRLADRFDRIVYGTRNTSFLTQNYNRYAPTSNGNTYGNTYGNTNVDYGEPMQIDTLRPRRPGSNGQRRRTQGLCFTCGRPGHIAMNCPATRQQQQFRKSNQQGKGRRQ